MLYSCKKMVRREREGGGERVEEIERDRDRERESGGEGGESRE